MTEDLLWPRYCGPDDLAAIEAVPLDARGLPGSTYDLLVRAAGTWPDRTALTVLPEAARWREPVRIEVDAAVEDGSVLVSVTPGTGDREAISAVLDQYALRWTWSPATPGPVTS
ncbi:hypothetical protein ABZX88_24405 [Kitasatospora aureofaciens]|uniref:hypothetical protein n=1 Tax=Kitasatospora aureofaciens TaxID=1894 RepID=UPI00052587C9|nr:hypothetical protein [Kitasatospora aureofaciens]HJD84406.1 hypothetical protein [Kitasatospora aureofaciens]